MAIRFRVGNPPLGANAKRRRRIRPETWSSINAAIVRERATLAAVAPNSPRIRPTLQRLRWLELVEAAA